jgi:hypothetical protein
LSGQALLLTSYSPGNDWMAALATCRAHWNPLQKAYRLFMVVKRVGVDFGAIGVLDHHLTVIFVIG